MNIHFYLRFYTRFGQSLWISGNSDELGNDDQTKAVALEYLNEEFWHCSVEIKKKDIQNNIRYKYVLKNQYGELLSEWGNDRLIASSDLFGDSSPKDVKEIQFVDTWNHAGEFENAFFLAPFSNVLLKSGGAKNKITKDKNYTHVFKVKAPLLQKNEIVCLLGNSKRLGQWSANDPILLKKEGNWWMAKLNLSDEVFPVAYKYGVFNNKEKKFIGYGIET